MNVHSFIRLLIYSRSFIHLTDAVHPFTTSQNDPLISFVQHSPLFCEWLLLFPVSFTYFNCLLFFFSPSIIYFLFLLSLSLSLLPFLGGLGLGLF